MRRAIVAWVLLLTCGPAAALDGCFAEAGSRYGIAPALLRAIARQESRLDPAAFNRNRDGSRDIGIMQINTWWLPRLAEYGVREEQLWEPCVNVHVGTWILALNVARYGYTWQAVGAYNAGTGKSEGAIRQRESYARKVADQLALRRSPRGLRDGAGEAR